MNILKSNLNLLVAFQALLDERSVTRAALRVGITQSAMSNALSRLRALLEDPLFVRRGGGMEPTERARTIAVDLRIGLDAFERVLSPPADFDPETAETAFVVSTNDYLELTVVPNLLRILAKKAPGCSLQILPWSRFGALPPELGTGEVDALLLSTTGMRLPAAYRSIHLFDDHYRVLVRENHPRISRRLSLRQYLAETHIVVTESLGADGGIDSYLARQGLRRRIAVRVPHFTTVPHLVAAGDSVAALDERAARVFAGAFPVRSMRLPLELPSGQFNMIWHRSSDEDPARCFLRNQIRAAAGNRGDATG